MVGEQGWHQWSGEQIVANGRIFFGDCNVCGWPKPDHPRTAPRKETTVGEREALIAIGLVHAAGESLRKAIDFLHDVDTIGAHDVDDVLAATAGLMNRLSDRHVGGDTEGRQADG